MDNYTYLHSFVLEASHMKQNLLLIINPVAGTKKPNKHLTDIINLFCENGYICQVHMTTPDYGADKIVEDYAKDKDMIVCIGGDGTFNEMISGLIKHNLSPTIGYIPSGSTNDFATGLGISLNPMKAARDIIEGTPCKIDAGVFNDRVFIYTSSFGVFTKSSYNTPRDLKNTLGYTAYVLEGAKEITNIPSIKLKVECKERILEGNYVFGAVCNTMQIGGGFVSFNKENVDMNDGLLEVLLIKYPRNPVELTQCLLELKSSKFNTPFFEFFSTGEITISTEDKIDWTIDGEYQKGNNKITVRCIKDAFTLILNKKEKRTKKKILNGDKL